MKEIHLTIDKKTIEEYSEYYKANHPLAKKPPIKHPYHESINTWMILKRPMMNALKQKWKNFIVWFVAKQGYLEEKIEKCTMHFIVYYPSKKRHDVDNTTPKFILDGFAESGLVVDDDYTHITKLILECGVDKTNPRTEIYIDIQGTRGI